MTNMTKKEPLYRVGAEFVVGESCRRCPFLRKDNISEMRFCRQTGRDLPYWDIYKDEACPLHVIEIINEEDKTTGEIAYE